jgi:DNA-binding NarL/FixJ family response regulator
MQHAWRTTRPRLILVDDHHMFVESLARVLAADHEIAGIAYSGDELLAMLPSTPSDCILLDLLLPKRHGLELIAPIRRHQPSTRVLVVTMMPDRHLADAAISAGASGFVPKDAGILELRAAISQVLAGRLYVSPLVPKSGHQVGLGAQHIGLCRLTPRQQEIVLLMGEGKSGVEISDALALCPSTITFHKHRIMRVLGIEAEASLRQYSVLVSTEARCTSDSTQRTGGAEGPSGTHVRPTRGAPLVPPMRRIRGEPVG